MSFTNNYNIYIYIYIYMQRITEEFSCSQMAAVDSGKSKLIATLGEIKLKLNL